MTTDNCPLCGIEIRGLYTDGEYQDTQTIVSSHAMEATWAAMSRSSVRLRWLREIIAIIACLDVKTTDETGLEPKEGNAEHVIVPGGPSMQLTATGSECGVHSC
jgi:hypothetical protein